MKNKTKIRLIAGSLAATMAFTLLTGCGSTKEPEYKNSSEYFSSLSEEDSKKENEKYNEAGVVINGDNALVFLSDYNTYANQLTGKYLQYGVDKFYGNVYTLKFNNKNDLETNINAIIGEDGIITYQDAYKKSDKSLENEAGVVINGNNALVFLYGYNLYSNRLTGKYLQHGEDKFYGNINDVRYKDKDDLEDKIKTLAGDDCTITYQEALIKMDRK